MATRTAATAATAHHCCHRQGGTDDGGWRSTGCCGAAFAHPRELLSAAGHGILRLSERSTGQWLYRDLRMPREAVRELVEPGLDLLCGRFSFAELPKSYCCILGVTGTLSELLEVPGIRTILEEEYGFKHYTYTPSIFGDRRLAFREASDVHVLDNEADWIARIESLIQDEKDAGNAVLVFFKNEQHLRKFPTWSNFECLTERTDPKRRSGYVAAATTAGRVTLLTRAFGRGIDFQMPDGHQLMVLQTFLSSLVSEETQIKGRTARQGKPGRYKLALCASHLEGKMSFTEHDLNVLKNGSGGQIKLKLQEKQKQKMMTKVAGMRARKEKAAKLEQETKKWEEMLFSKDIHVQTKLMELAKWNGMDAYQQVHYTMLLDNSGSMGGRPWQQLTLAFQSFKAELLKEPEIADATRVSTILFSHMVQVINPHHAMADEVTDIHHLTVGGGTDFGAAFRACRQIIGRSSSEMKEIIVFRTDGGSDVPTEEINGLLADHGARITSFIYIAFGRGADAVSLKQIEKLFTDRHIQVKPMVATDQTSLVERFKEAAESSRPVHGV